MTTERDCRPADPEPTTPVAPEGTPPATAATYEPPALVLLGTLRDLTAVGSFPDPT